MFLFGLTSKSYLPAIELALCKNVSSLCGLEDRLVLHDAGPKFDNEVMKSFVLNIEAIDSYIEIETFKPPGHRTATNRLKLDLIKPKLVTEAVLGIGLSGVGSLRLCVSAGKLPTLTVNFEVCGVTTTNITQCLKVSND